MPCDFAAPAEKSCPVALMRSLRGGATQIQGKSVLPDYDRINSFARGRCAVCPSDTNPRCERFLSEGQTAEGPTAKELIPSCSTRPICPEFATRPLRGTREEKRPRIGNNETVPTPGNPFAMRKIMRKLSILFVLFASFCFAPGTVCPAPRPQIEPAIPSILITRAEC